MSRFGSFRSRARRGYSNFKQRASGFGRRTRRRYSSKTLGMKTSTLLKLAVVGVLGFMFKDKLKPLFDNLFKKK